MVTTEDLEGLKTRLGISGNTSDSLLKQMLVDAESAILDYCNRDFLPSGAHGLLRELAALYYRRSGSEGEASRSEGAISVSYETTIPHVLQQRLNRWRLSNFARMVKGEIVDES